MYLLPPYSHSRNSERPSGTTNKSSKPPHSRSKHHLYFPIFSTKKASPTVCITNTSVSRAITACLLPSPSGLPDVPPQNFIPFPSSPIACPASSDTADGMDCESEPDSCKPHKGEDVSPANHHIWHIDLHHRRSKSCLATSYFHRDNLPPRTPHEASVNSMSHSLNRVPHLRTRKEKSELRSQGAAARRESMSAGSAAPHPKRTRRNRRSQMDGQFLAAVHRSIAWRMRRALVGIEDAYTAQDALLVERLWRNLVNQGFQPAQSEHELDLTAPPFSDDSSPPNPFCLPASPPQSMPVPSTPDLLTMPQLVASLTLRYKDRSSTRPRSSSSVLKMIESAPAPRPSSPLARTVYLPEL
ncbi:hypothetical protein A0H81_04998 [Grifola frondosa]|uniref:Uncharacterized protein n=1 Tax=Grifola frondosa TaxID=5627 RepID=A0A1C7ML97_GRIFR|nr:hypothetical protein A0H81_04998 [Grifola frondosa]